MDRSTVLIRPEDARKQPGIWLGAIRERASAVLQHVTGTDFEEKIRRLEAYRGHERMDSFGLDLEWVRVALVAVAVLHRFYFRVDASGLENVPAGRVLLIANHSGQLPIDDPDASWGLHTICSLWASGGRTRKREKAS